MYTDLRNSIILQYIFGLGGFPFLPPYATVTSKKIKPHYLGKFFIRIIFQL